MKDQHDIDFSLSKNDHCEKTKTESLEPYILRYLGAAGSRVFHFHSQIIQLGVLPQYMFSTGNMFRLRLKLKTLVRLNMPHSKIIQINRSMTL